MELVTPGLGLVFWMTVTFTLVLVILKKAAWKPILNALKEREDSIEKALNSAKEAESRMADIQNDSKKLLEEARIEREKLMREANATAAAIIEKSKGEAEVQAKRIADEAREAIINEKRAALTEVKNMVGVISLEIAEKILKKSLANDAAQQELVNECLKEVKLN